MSKQIEVICKGTLVNRTEYFDFEKISKIFCINSSDESLPRCLRLDPGLRHDRQCSFNRSRSGLSPGRSLLWEDAFRLGKEVCFYVAFTDDL